MEYLTSLCTRVVSQLFLALHSHLSNADGDETVTGARFVSPRIRLYLGLVITFAVMPAIPAVPKEIELLSSKAS